MDNQAVQPPGRPVAWRAKGYLMFKADIRLLRTERTPKLLTRRTEQRNKRIWTAVVKAYPADHRNRKHDLCEALFQAGEATENASTVNRRLTALIAAGPNGDQPQHFRDIAHQTGRYLDALIARLRAEAPVELAIERIVTRKEPLADLIDHYDQRAQNLSRSIRRVARQLRTATGNITDDAATRTINRELLQRRLFEAEEGHGFFKLEGGNRTSQLGIWVESDGNGNIVDRTVVKDVYYDNPDYPDGLFDHGLWTDPDDVLDKVPLEVNVMLKLNEVESPNIVVLRNFFVYPGKAMFRMLMEYCPYGDANDWSNKYSIDTRNQSIPEPAIWYLLECLVNVGLILLQGSTDTNAPRPEWGNEIVHRDIKPDNIFLGPFPEPTGDNWAMYPVFKVGDYGLAIETSDDDPNNPAAYLHAGTFHYMAPEQDLNPDWNMGVEDDDGHRFNEKTNVFGIGMTIMNIMARHNRDLGVTDWTHARRNPAAFPLRLSVADSAHYSQILVSTINNCANVLQDDRPSFADLQRIIRNNTGLASDPARADFANGARTSTLAQRDNHPDSVRHLPAEKYAHGMSLQAAVQADDQARLLSRQASLDAEWDQNQNQPAPAPVQLQQLPRYLRPVVSPDEATDREQSRLNQQWGGRW
ncbi:hypothetical protein Q7P37_004039 [Cladosporium fusiforme]